MPVYLDRLLQHWLSALLTGGGAERFVMDENDEVNAMLDQVPTASPGTQRHELAAALSKVAAKAEGACISEPPWSLSSASVLPDSAPLEGHLRTCCYSAGCLRPGMI